MTPLAIAIVAYLAVGAISARIEVDAARREVGWNLIGGLIGAALMVFLWFPLAIWNAIRGNV